MTPSEELKAAAGRIREVAKSATPGAWAAEADARYRRVETVGGDQWVASTGTVDDDPEAAADTTHIALWDPPTAELVADLLDGMAAHWATRPIGDLDIYLSTPLCKLARHILGGTP